MSSNDNEPGFMDEMPTADDAKTESANDSGFPEFVGTPPTEADATDKTTEEKTPERPAVSRSKSATPPKKKSTKTSQSSQSAKKAPAAKKTAPVPRPGDTPKEPEKVDNVPQASPQELEPPKTATATAGEAIRPSRPVLPPPRVSTAPPTNTTAGQVTQPPEQADLVASSEPVILGSSKLPQVMVHRWDEMMSTVSSATRNAIWEQGLQSMEELLRTPRNDLTKPRGQLTTVQCEELAAWLGRHGYLLPTVSTAATGRTVAKLGRPAGKSVDVKSGKEVGNEKIRIKRIEQMRKLRSCG